MNPYVPKGMITAVVTPFHADESLDLERLGAHIEDLIQAGTAGLAVLAGCGEYLNLSHAERSRVIEVAVAAAARRVPVIVGALSPATTEVLQIGEVAARCGADALLVLPPYYLQPSIDGVVEHFARVGAATDLPVIVYNNPGRTGFAVTVDILDRLAELPAVVAIKDCDRDVAEVQRKIECATGRLVVLSGDDDLAFACLLAGASGGVWATANVAPELCLELHAACARNDLARARELQRVILDLVAVRKLPNHPGPLKEMMAMAGRSVGPARRPLVAMTDVQRARCRAAIEAHRTFLMHKGEVHGR